MEDVRGDSRPVTCDQTFFSFWSVKDWGGVCRTNSSPGKRRAWWPLWWLWWPTRAERRNPQWLNYLWIALRIRQISARMPRLLANAPITALLLLETLELQTAGDWSVVHARCTCYCGTVPNMGSSTTCLLARNPMQTEYFGMKDGVWTDRWCHRVFRFCHSRVFHLCHLLPPKRNP